MIRCWLEKLFVKPGYQPKANGLAQAKPPSGGSGVRKPERYGSIFPVFVINAPMPEDTKTSADPCRWCGK